MIYSELDLRNMIRNVSNTPDGLEFIYFLLDSFGTFTNKVNLGNSDMHNIVNTIKKEQGEFILDLLREYNFEKFVEIHKKRSSEKCQKTLN